MSLLSSTVVLFIGPIGGLLSSSVVLFIGPVGLELFHCVVLYTVSILDSRLRHPHLITLIDEKHY